MPPHRTEFKIKNLTNEEEIKDMLDHLMTENLKARKGGL